MKDITLNNKIHIQEDSKHGLVIGIPGIRDVIHNRHEYWDYTDLDLLCRQVAESLLRQLMLEHT